MHCIYHPYSSNLAHYVRLALFVLVYGLIPSCVHILVLNYLRGLISPSYQSRSPSMFKKCLIGGRMRGGVGIVQCLGDNSICHFLVLEEILGICQKLTQPCFCNKHFVWRSWHHCHECNMCNVIRNSAVIPACVNWCHLLVFYSTYFQSLKTL